MLTSDTDIKSNFIPGGDEIFILLAVAFVDVLAMIQCKILLW